MLHLITMTPWEHRDKYIQRNKKGYEIYDNVDMVFNRYIACDVFDWGNGKPLIGELVAKPVYAEYIAQYHGSECDFSPLKFSEKGYTYECDSYISSINTLRSNIKTGLCILCAASYGFNVYANKNDLDKITIDFLARREEDYTVFLNLFSDFSSEWYKLDKSLHARITIDGITLTEENLFNLVGYCDKIIRPEYVVQSKKEYDRRNQPSHHDPYRFDTLISLTARDFIMDIERRETSVFGWNNENELEERVHGGKCTKLFLGYEIIIHTQSLLDEFYAKYPVVFAVWEHEDGGMECGQFHLVKYPTLLEMLNDMYNDAYEKGYSRAIYAVWNKPFFEDNSLYRMDLFDDVELYVEIDAKNKQLHIYDNGYFGRKKFFEFYRDDAKFIED